jgi:hypothetical protein
MTLLSGSRGGTRMLVPVGGGTPDREQVERFKAQQRALGMEVREISGGGLMIRPAPPASSPALKEVAP